MKVYVLIQLCGEPANAYCEGVFSVKEDAIKALKEFYEVRKADWLNPETYNYKLEDIKIVENIKGMKITMENAWHEDYIELKVEEMVVDDILKS